MPRRLETALLLAGAAALLPLGAATQAAPATPSATSPTIDTNADGKPDAWDRDGDGKADAWDSNGDGKPDAMDDNRDGKPDGTVPAEPAPAATPTAAPTPAPAH